MGTIFAEYNPQRNSIDVYRNNWWSYFLQEQSPVAP